MRLRRRRGALREIVRLKSELDEIKAREVVQFVKDPNALDMTEFMKKALQAIPPPNPASTVVGSGSLWPQPPTLPVDWAVTSTTIYPTGLSYPVGSSILVGK